MMRVRTGWLVLGLATMHASAFAAENDASPPVEDGAEEIVVTGERIARTIRETSSSVAVTTSTDIESLADANRAEDVIALVPNVQLGAGDSAPTIRGEDTGGVLRGADAFLGGSRPRATLSVDGRALSYNEFVYGSNALWDVDRVELFRGPQTTTQGRNAIAGAIFIETKNPTYDWQVAARVLIGNGSTEAFSGALSGPVVADQVAFRASFDRRDSRSYVNRPTQTRDLIGEDPLKNDYSLGRVKLLVEPAALPGFRALLTYSHLDSTAPQAEAVDAPFRARSSANDQAALFRTKSDAVIGGFNVDLASSLALATTLSFADIDVQRLTIPGAGDADVDTRELSAEAVLRYATSAARVSGLLGAYALDVDQDEVIDLSAFLARGTFTDRARSFGVFGEASVRPINRLTLTAGLRYQRDRQDRDGALGPFTVDYDRAFDAWLPKFVAAYDLTDALRVGASATRGFNPGGTTISFNTGEQDVFDAETLWAYEVFARATLAPRVQLNANLFHTAFRDAQRGTITIVNGQIDGNIANAERARSQGAEVDLSWRTSDLTLRAGIGLLDTKLQRYSISAAPIEGKSFARAPGFSAFAAATLTPAAGLALSGQARYADGYFSDDLNSAELKVAKRVVVDAQIAYDLRGFRLFAFARNLFDDFYLAEIYSPKLGVPGEPRRIGAGVEVRF